MRTIECDTERLIALKIGIQLRDNGIVVVEYALGGTKTLYRGEFDDTDTNVPST